MPHTDRIRQLIATLDRENTNAAEEAQFELIEHFGAEALEPLIAAVPHFAYFGRLCAIEIFESIKDPRAAAVLIPWLKSDNEVVRERSAGALGSLGVTDAIPDLLVAWDAAKGRGTPPDWSEPVTIRRALTQLGARDVVLPPGAARLEVDTPWDHAWPASALPHVFEQLAQAGQVVLYFQYWTRHPEYDPSAWYGITDADTTLQHDWASPWEALVDASSRQAVASAMAATVPPGTVATVEWMDRSDL
jgi:HEAT repeats